MRKESVALGKMQDDGKWNACGLASGRRSGMCTFSDMGTDAQEAVVDWGRGVSQDMRLAP